MPDDICGAECADDTPCQHPAGSCPVPSHSDSDVDENPQGRPSEFTDERARAALDAARHGLSKAGCERAAAVGDGTLNEWLSTDPTFTTESGEEQQFSRAFRRARSEGEKTLVREPLYDDDIDGQHARFLLSSSFDYAEKRELDADVDQTTTHELGEGEKDLALETLRELQAEESA